ncbi:MAG: arylsulfatase [Candidatus Tectomicrobia bacterium]|nr:arylsulfatase [Candidatus Tectomicrobia bacterium]
MRQSLRQVWITVITALLAWSVLISGAAAEDKPNVVIMMVDNLGWGELGVYGGGVLRGAETPRLDKLASEGVRFLNFNVEPQCTPSRSAFMTGRHPIRSGTTKVVWGMLYGMTQWEKTIPELMSEQGYATGMFGKWHLGDTPGRFPTDQGFEEWYGIANTTDEAMYSSHHAYDADASVKPYVVKATRNGTPKQIKEYNLEARRHIDGELTEKAIAFMKASAEKKKPFFAFVPFTHAHLPTTAHPDFDGKTGNGPYADVLAEIDHRTGQILDAIDNLGIRDNTVVLWLSDNGPEEIEGYHGTAGYWRGNYFTALEGSLRVPALMRWPSKIAAGQVTNEIVHIVDVLPTLSQIAGYKIPDDRLIDGVAQLDFLLGKQPKSNREGFPVFNGDDLFGYKWRNWKMHFIQLDSMFGAPAKLNMPHLHNLISDPKELYPVDKVNVSASWVFPVVLKKVVEFRKTLMTEPPIQLGTPDPYMPKGR